MRKLLKKYRFAPDKLVTDDLRSYRAAAQDLGISYRHERGRWRNNRAENLQRPTPSDFGKNASSLSGGCDECVARSSFRRLIIFEA